MKILRIPRYAMRGYVKLERDGVGDFGQPTQEKRRLMGAPTGPSRRSMEAPEIAVRRTPSAR